MMQCLNCGRECDADATSCEACGTSLRPHVDPEATQTGTYQATSPSVSSTSARPISFQGDRYKIKSFLGQGAKKRVYLVTDTLLDRDVALALINTQGLDDVARQRILREAQIMGRLGDHPNIVPIYDLGEEGDQAFMVIPVMVGGSVEDYIRRAAGSGLPLDMTLHVARDVCAGLEYAHSKDVVHRDLKPSNVWLTGDLTSSGEPGDTPSTGSVETVAKIGDFGIALSLDQPRLTEVSSIVGTRQYMSPEQALGGEVTPLSDLYSLGVMLYEMVTGSPPFTGGDLAAVIGQHINAKPIPPTRHNPSCPRMLDVLILRLLEKSPERRPQSASDVLAILETISADNDQARGSSESTERSAADSLSTSSLVGRDSEMDILKSMLENALAGQGALAMVTGEAGIGKTRILEELSSYAGLRNVQVLWGRCYEEEGIPPYWPWIQVIRSFVRDHEPDEIRLHMGAGAANISEIVPDLKEKLPDLQAPPPLDSPEEARFRLFDSIATFLKTASQHRPLAIVLDDLHWADKSSLLMLQFIAREIGESRLLLIGAYRDMELDRRHPLTEALGDLSRQRLFERVNLSGLTEGDVGQFIEVTAGTPPPQGLPHVVHTRTEGNPLFVKEVVRLLMQEGELTSDPTAVSGRADESGSWTVQIPEGVRDVIGLRLNRLSQRCYDALTVASVIGREFEFGYLIRLIDDLTEDALLDVLDEALDAHVVEELPDQIERYQFTHALIQETLMSELSRTRRVRIHARIARMLEEYDSGNPEARAAELAYHFYEGAPVLGNDGLIRYSLMAGAAALRSFAHEEALVHYERGLAAKEDQPTDDDTAALLFGLGRVQVATRQRREALSTLSRAFEYYIGEGNMSATVDVAERLPLIPGFSGVSESLSRALELVPPDSHAAGRLLARYGLSLNYEKGDYESSQQVFSQALEIARREGDEALEMEVLANTSSLDANNRRWQDVLTKSLRVIELAQRADNTYAEMRARLWAAFSLIYIGELERATEYASTSLALAERIRDIQTLMQAIWANETVARVKGDWETSDRLIQRGLQLVSSDPFFLSAGIGSEYLKGEFEQGKDFMDRLLETMDRTTPAPIHVCACVAIMIPMVADISGVSEGFETAREAARQVLSSPASTPIFADTVNAGLALMAVREGDAERADELYKALLPTSGTIINGGAMVCDRVLGLLAWTMGREDQAIGHFEDALEYCIRAGYLNELAWTYYNYGERLLDSSVGPSQTPNPVRDKATSLLDAALTIATDLGMKPLMEKVATLRETIES